MTVRFEKSTASGRVKAPPSKSMAHRYLICGALSGGSVINGIDYSEDIKATLKCLKSLGADISLSKDTVTIGEIDFEKGISSSKLSANESGSTLRFLIPLCLIFEKQITISGSERLFSRSLSVYEEICKAQGLKFIIKENSVTLKGRLQSGKYVVRGDISSQFISGLMFALSKLPNDSLLEIEGAIESGSYLNLTIKALADFGVRISRIDERTIYIKGNQTYKKREITVEGDYSNAAFLDAFNLFGGNVMVKGLSSKSVQGDMVYRDIFKELIVGCPTIDISDCPDLAPVIMAVAAAKNGVVLTGTKRLKIKESDRGEAMKSELEKMGAEVLVEDNKITVKKAELHSPERPIFSHNDHRIVMAMSVLLSITGGEIVGAEAVAKSYPKFFDDILALGVNVKVV